MKLSQILAKLDKETAQKLVKIVAGWDGVPVSEVGSDVIRFLAKDHPTVEWLLKTQDACFGVSKKSNDFVVVLCDTKQAKSEGYIYFKFMAGSDGPYTRPPEKFWMHPKVKQMMHPEYIEIQRKAKTTNEIAKAADYKTYKELGYIK